MLLLWADEDPAHPADRRLRGARPAAEPPAADPAGDRVPDGVRRPGRGGARVDLVLRVRRPREDRTGRTEATRCPPAVRRVARPDARLRVRRSPAAGCSRLAGGRLSAQLAGASRPAPARPAPAWPSARARPRVTSRNLSAPRFGDISACEALMSRKSSRGGRLSWVLHGFVVRGRGAVDRGGSASANPGSSPPRTPASQRRRRAVEARSRRYGSITTRRRRRGCPSIARQHHPDRHLDQALGVPREARERWREQDRDRVVVVADHRQIAAGSSARARGRRRRRRRRSSPRSRTRRWAGVSAVSTVAGDGRSPRRARTAR